MFCIYFVFLLILVVIFDDDLMILKMTAHVEKIFQVFSLT